MIKKFNYSLINVDINYIHYHFNFFFFWCIQIKYYCQESSSLWVITLNHYKLYPKLHIEL